MNQRMNMESMTTDNKYLIYHDIAAEMTDMFGEKTDYTTLHII